MTENIRLAIQSNLPASFAFLVDDARNHCRDCLHHFHCEYHQRKY